MSLANSKLVHLSYGEQGRFACEISSERMYASRPAPEPIADFAEELKAALARPLDFPSLTQSVIPDDRVAVCLDPDTPRAAEVVAAIWPFLARRDVVPENVSIIQPPGSNGAAQYDPRQALPKGVRRRVGWTVHDPDDPAACAYIAATASGERVYLARAVIDADVVVTVGPIVYDPLIGVRGTNSVLYPGLSTAETVAKARGQGHLELGPEEVRPLRQVMDEIGWLLGAQFAVQVVPSSGGGAVHVLAGLGESVFRRGRDLLAESWLVELDSRPDIVVAAVDRDASGHGWEQLSSALATARNLVSKDGRIIILSELESEPGPGVGLVRQHQSPRKALRPLRELSPADLVPATQLADALGWASVYLLSRLDNELVEDLFMTPLADTSEVARLLRGDETCVFLQSAQHVYGRIGSK